MAQWQYSNVNTSECQGGMREEARDVFLKRLNEFGKEKWEVVSVQIPSMRDGTYYEAILKKPL